MKATHYMNPVSRVIDANWLTGLAITTLQREVEESAAV